MRKLKNRFIVSFILVCLLTVIYFANDKINPINTDFKYFQAESDRLVLASIATTREDGKIPSAYGLGYITSLHSNSVRDYKLFFPITGWNTADGKVVDGYCVDINGLGFSKNNYTVKYLKKGITVRFENGLQYKISNVNIEGNTLYVQLDTREIISSQTCGDITNVTLYDESGEKLPGVLFEDYVSQIGLQGKVISIVSKFLPQRYIYSTLKVGCCFALAMCVVITTYLLAKKYDKLFAICYFVVFRLSPWVANFAKSIYWVQFTWSIPFIFGLILSIEHYKKYHKLRLAGVFISIFVKCRCGYEYITFIMIGTILPLICDRIQNLIDKNRKAFTAYTKRIFITGLIALAGFATALVIHSSTRGGGDVFVGIKRIYEQDILRRTLGGNVADFDSDVARSIQASLGEVLGMYFDFSNQIIMSIPGSLFIPLMSISAAFTVIAILDKSKDKTCVVFYFMSFISSITWFVLGKQHSYVHPHMNYVCWYYWFIPAMFYMIVKGIVDIKNRIIK